MSIAKAALESTSQQLAGSLVMIERIDKKQSDKGIRVNILRSSPVNTLAARGIPQFLVSLYLVFELGYEERVL